MSELRFALLGCGRIAPKHVKALANGVVGAKIAAVCDIDPNKAQKLGEELCVPWFTELDSMLKEQGEHIDVVNILTLKKQFIINMMVMIIVFVVRNVLMISCIVFGWILRIQMN